MDHASHQASTSGGHNFSEIITEGNTLQHSDFVLRETPQKNTILHVAAKQKQVETARKIIEKHPSLLHQTNSKHDTPLHIAARVGCLEIAQLLIESTNKDQDVEGDKKLLRMVNVRKETALHDAVRNGHFQVVKLLIGKDSDLASMENDAGVSALFLAVDRKCFVIARYILQVAPSFSYRGRNRMNVMHAAIIRTTKDYYLNMLHRSVIEDTYYTSFFIFRLTLKRFFELGCTEIDFMEEVKKKCPSTILEADDFGWIPLHYAAHFGHVEAVELFLKDDNNSLAYSMDSEGMSAIHIAAKQGHVDIMTKLIRLCPDAKELLENNGRTALHVAAASGRADVVKYVLKTPDFDGLINEQDKKGNTPLMLAGIFGKYEVAFLLANDSRVDKGVVNQEGQAAIDIIFVHGDIPPKDKVRIARKLKWNGGLTKKCLGKVIKAEDWIRKQQPKTLKDIASFDLLVVTIIATVAFAAGYTMPGGYEDNGDAILTKKKEFFVFMISDALAFFCSALAIFIHFWAVWIGGYTYVRLIRAARLLTTISIITMMFAFTAGTIVVLQKSKVLANTITPLFFLPIVLTVILFYL